MGHVRIFQKKDGEIPEEQQRQQRGAQEGQTRQDAAEVPQEFRALGQDFLPEELNILAVTGASGFGGGPARGEKLWTAVHRPDRLDGGGQPLTSTRVTSAW